jgi:transcriptional regulator with XRE-family HTH domain
MDTLIPAFLRRQRNQRRLTLEMLSAKVGMSPQHLSEIESGKRDPRLSSIERMADALGMTVLIVPDAMAHDLRRYVANNGRIYTTHAGQAAAAPNHTEALNADHMPKKKPDPAPIPPKVPSPETSSLSFTIETFDDPETGKPTQYGRLSRKWQDEEALVAVIDKLEAGQLSHKQALIQARML